MEATFFALLMSVYNAGQQLSRVLGGYLYDRVGFAPLVLISAGVDGAGVAARAARADRPDRGRAAADAPR